MAIQSITAGPRQSNFEVLRIIAMTMVLMVHANFLSIGAPTAEEIGDNFLGSLSRVGFETLSLFCVNLFIMISGWFTIRPSVKGLCGFLFQVFYFATGIYIVLIAVGKEPFSFGRLYQIFILNKSGWFVISYVILYLLSPLLNKFIEHASQKEFNRFLIPYLTLLVFFGWVNYSVEIGKGFSALSFVGMYLLSAYSRKYMSRRHGGTLFLISWILNTCLALAELRFKIIFPINCYDNPLVISGALGLVWYFGNLRINTSRVINYVAKSTFAIYLLHIYPDLFELFKQTCKAIYIEYGGIAYFARITLFLLAVFCASITADIPRRLIWNAGMRFVKKIQS